MYAKVIPTTKVVGATDSFDYIVPADLVVEAGSIVKIPFGKRHIIGVVAEVYNKKSDSKYQLKSITAVIDYFKLPEPYLEVAAWIKNYYFCTLGQAIELFLPPIMKRPKSAPPEVEKKAKGEIVFSDAQEKVFLAIKKSIDSDQYKATLIHGVTGSGKTEIYIKLAEEVVKKGKQVVMLVPEIMLTPQTVERFQKFFGDEIVLMHSKLSKSEKLSTYQKFYSGEKKIILGPRSALLVPSNNLGLIIIDEEQEDSYKQEQIPRYHAVTLAKNICKSTGAYLVLGSATPSVETTFEFKNKYQTLHLDERYSTVPLPETKVIDLKDEIKNRRYGVLSKELKENIEQILSSKKQILLFLNRRGMASFVSCRSCGFVEMCPHCSIPMIYHIFGGENTLLCHHCGHKSILSTVCPKCASPFYKYFGSGVDKVEKEVKECFPQAKLLVITKDTIKSRDDYNQAYRKIVNHEVDIVIGTQMIAKGLDIPNVDLVGIISADVGLHLPQYKSHERVFQLITQVSGRSGRRLKRGKTIIQTYWPQSHTILSASEHDYGIFYEKEIEEREKYNYPPFCQLVRLISENENEQKALENIKEAAIILEKNKVNYIGPGKCFYQKLRGKFRYHIICKFAKVETKPIMEIINSLPDLVIDRDPIELL